MTTDLGEKLFMNTLTAHELAMEEMYRVFEEKVQGDTKLWSRLATEENGHAALIKAMLEAAEEGAVLIPAERIPTSALKVVLESLRSNVRVWRRHGLKRKEAFAYAIDQEISIIENCLTLPFEFEDRRLFETCQQMADASRAHAEQLRNASSLARKTVVGLKRILKREK